MEQGQGETIMQQVDRLQKIKEKGILTVLSTDTQPYSYRDTRTGEFSGIEAEIIREVAKRLGVKVVVPRYTTFTNLFTEFVNNPDIDIITDGIYITEERKELFYFTMPLYNDWGAILIKKDSNINSREDLKNRILGVHGGTVYENIAQSWKTQNFIKDYIAFSNSQSLRLALLNKNVDAILADSIVAQDALMKNPQTNLKLLSPTQYKSEIVFDIGYHIKKEDITLLNAVNEKLQEMKNDGTLYEILTKHGIRDHYIP